ncbi:MAG TPA: slipin family protein, partial [Bacteroidia bacterium]
MLNYVRIDAYKVGLVFRNGNYDRVITEGTHWLRLSERVMEYDLAKPFVPPANLNILLKDDKLAALLEVLTVKDNEIALYFE